MQKFDTLFEHPNSDKATAVGLMVSVRALFKSDKVFLGTTDDAAIPLPLSSRIGGKLKSSDQQAVFVGCGAASTGLCALHFDQQKDVDQFIAVNPISKKTLVTRGLCKELVFWFWCRDSVPGNTMTSTLRWYSTGLIPVAWATENLELRILRRSPVAETNFADLRWDSESERVFWITRQISLYGPLIQKIGRRKHVLNDGVICRIFAKDAEIMYDTVLKQFLRKGISGQFEQFSEADLLDLLAAWLHHLASDNGSCFPTAELRLPRLRSMIEHLRVVAAVFEPAPQDALRTYLKSRLCARPGANVTVEEVDSDFSRYAKQHRIGRYPRCRFLRLLPKLIEEVFGIVRAHNLKRLNQEKNQKTDRRGFHNLTFRDVADGPDEPDGCLDKTAQRVSK